MNRKQLIKIIKENTDCTGERAEKTAMEIIEAIKESVFNIVDKPSVHILGLFTVSPKVYEPRMFNVNGKMVEKDRRFRLKIKPGVLLRRFCGID